LFGFSNVNIAKNVQPFFPCVNAHIRENSFAAEELARLGILLVIVTFVTAPTTLHARPQVPANVF